MDPDTAVVDKLVRGHGRRHGHSEHSEKLEQLSEQLIKQLFGVRWTPLYTVNDIFPMIYSYLFCP